jgi:uncharacterized Zn finger protein
MYFAETGRMPDGKKGAPRWPLPEVPADERTARPNRVERTPGPDYAFLVNLAIHEKRTADVLRWYDAWVKQSKDRYGGAGSYSERVADAVRKDFPERALEIYRRLANHFLRDTGDSAYRNAVNYLRKVKEVMVALGRGPEWQTYEAELREQYKRRKKFIEMLDRSRGGKIVEGGA